MKTISKKEGRAALRNLGFTDDEIVALEKNAKSVGEMIAHRILTDKGACRAPKLGWK